MIQNPLIKEKISNLLREQVLKMRSDSLVRIAPERTLAEELGVSRVSLKAAIKSLINEGILIQIQGKGTYITPVVKLNSLHIICSPDIKSNDPFYNKFLVEVTNLAAKNSINLFIVDSSNVKAAAEADPLIIIGLVDEDIMGILRKVYKNIIAIQDYSLSEGLLQVYFDDYKIGCKAAQILVEYGHKHVVHLAGPEKFPSAAKRKLGFLDTLKKSEITVKVLTEKMNWAGGYKAADSILEYCSQEKKPTAVFTANDWMAAGCIQKFKEKGLKVPEDISVIGCDNIPLASEFFPALTTFNLDMKHLVEEVFTALNHIDSLTYKENKKILIPAKFISRDSLIKI